MNYEFLLLERKDAVALLTINSPDTLNALSSLVLAELALAMAELEQDKAVKVVVLTGAGKAFVAGADIKEMASMTSLEGHSFSEEGQAIIEFIGRMTKPVIAAVNGFALGGGLELALACDFIYLSEKAKLGLPEVTLGVIPGFGGTQTLARHIGTARAGELLYTGKMIGADQAMDWGIANYIFPPEELVEQALATAAAIASVGSLAVSHAKKALLTGIDMPREEGLRYEAALFGILFGSQDQKEGMRAFVEKRKAQFTGK